MAEWRTLAWRGTDPDRIEAAQVVLGARTLRARGSSTAADHVLDWVLDCRADWETQRLSVRAHGDGWARSLDLTRDGDGWHARRRKGEAAHEEEVDLGPLGLDEALDCDLARCPFTNVMPILRHDLVGAAQAELDLAVDLVMAWVDVPELTVHRSLQRYNARGPDGAGGAVIGFASEGFTADITVDADGFVVDYPAIGTRIVP